MVLMDMVISPCRCCLPNGFESWFPVHSGNTPIIAKVWVMHFYTSKKGSINIDSMLAIAGVEAEGRDR